MAEQSAQIKSILSNLEQVTELMTKAAMSAGRNIAQVKLVVVTKQKPVSVIESAINVGIKDFGENYPEQAQPKIEALKNHADIRWHMIGHLQSRKSALIVQNFHMMHSLDSLKLAKKLNALLVEEKKHLTVLVQFNVGGETSKYGWLAWDESKWPELIQEIQCLQEFSNLNVCGLMTMPPYEEDIEKARPHFVKLKRLQEFLAHRLPGLCWDELSMGTSLDFEAAIQEGATIIRVGQAILGERP